LQLSLFDEQDLAEIASPNFPGERLIACRNPLLAADRARKREELLRATEPALQAVVDATRRENRPLRGKDRIGVRVGRVLERSKVSKHFRHEITEDSYVQVSASSPQPREPRPVQSRRARRQVHERIRVESRGSIAAPTPSSSARARRRAARANRSCARAFRDQPT